MHCFSYDWTTGGSHAVFSLNVDKPRTVRIGDFNGWREEHSRSFGFRDACDAIRFLEACGYIRDVELQGVETLPNGANAIYGWWHPSNGSCATLQVVTVMSK